MDQEKYLTIEMDTNEIESFDFGNKRRETKNIETF